MVLTNGYESAAEVQGFVTEWRESVLGRRMRELVSALGEGQVRRRENQAAAAAKRVAANGPAGSMMRENAANSASE